LDAAWKRKTAEQVLNGLCEARLAKNMCMQFRWCFDDVLFCGGADVLYQNRE